MLIHLCSHLDWGFLIALIDSSGQKLSVSIILPPSRAFHALLYALIFLKLRRRNIKCVDNSWEISDLRVPELLSGSQSCDGENKSCDKNQSHSHLNSNPEIFHIVTINHYSLLSRDISGSLISSPPEEQKLIFSFITIKDSRETFPASNI